MEKTFTKPELRELSSKLLHLHKALLQFEQKEYEEKFGKIASPHRLLELLMADAHFAWLRALSGLIVGIDELVDSKEEMPKNQVSDLLKYTQSLLKGNKEGSEFSKKYFAAIQKDPHIALAHGRIMHVLR